jgi:hypothetical protein
MVIDTPQRSDSDLVKQQWLRAKIESELKRLHISQFSTTCTNHSFFQLVLACDDDGKNCIWWFFDAVLLILQSGMQ